VAVLLCGIDVTPQPAQNALNWVFERIAENQSQLRAEGPLNPGLHHVHAPEQQGNKTERANQRDGKIHAIALGKRGKGGTEMSQ
jgi:hypothetical protein